jgi:hypothetical protein
MFFNSQPNFLYPDFKDKNNYKLSKNLFRRVRARNSFNAIFSASTNYTIQSGQTVEQLSFNLYNDSEYYWAILLLNNIIDIHSQWPLSSNELDNYIDTKYGSSVDNIRHWETDNVRDNNLGQVLEQGVIVEYAETASQQVSNYLPDWSFEYYTTSTTNNVTTQVVNTVTASQGLTAVTNREYEYIQNENKREIVIPNKKYLGILEEELETLLAYDTEYQINNDGLRISEPFVRT